MIKFSQYQRVTVTYNDGKFAYGYLGVIVEKDDKKIVNQQIILKDHEEAMTALRNVERMAGRSAKMVEDTYYPNRRNKWAISMRPRRFITKEITFSMYEFD